MERLRSLIKEVLTTPPKEKCGCGCGCGDSDNEGVTLNESLVKKDILSENLRYHVDKQLPLTENTFRYGSDSFLNLWAEARALYLREIIHVNEDDKEILEETNLGNYGIYEGKKVPLDLPLIDDSGTPPTDPLNEAGNSPAYKGSEGYDDSCDCYPEDELDEAKEKKKNPPLGKPKRGGSKKFYVYVKNPKTKKIKKVSFGDTSGLSAKINNPEARRAFAARHDCKNKKDKTKASYWSCRLPRYAKLLGLKSSFSGFW